MTRRQLARLFATRPRATVPAAAMGGEDVFEREYIDEEGNRAWLPPHMPPWGLAALVTLLAVAALGWALGWLR